MTLNEFRLEMASYRQSADEEAKSQKDPYIVLERLWALYGKFDSSERQMADQVLAEWALSEDDAVRYDALVLIDDLKIHTALPALQELTRRLASSGAVSAPYELKTVHQVIAELG